MKKPVQVHHNVFIEPKKQRLREGGTRLRHDFWLIIENSLLSSTLPPQKIYHMKMLCMVSFFRGLPWLCHIRTP